MKVSVVICTYNPDRSNLDRVIYALQQQTLSREVWEMIIVDNNSDVPLKETLDLSWHPHALIVREERPGLAFARITGVKNVKSNLVVFVDDDNVLDRQYLKVSVHFSMEHPEVGCYGGRSFPLYETTPPAWLPQTGIDLGCQDFGDETYITDFASAGFKINFYPEKAPIGTGMVIRKDAFEKYSSETGSNNERLNLGRKGKALTSGEDNDIILTVVRHGYELAYVPALMLQHLIPKRRFSKTYLEKMAYESNRSWVKVLHMHRICPWERVSPASVPLRKFKYWLTMKPWKNEVTRISYKERCGRIKGLSELRD
jgi:glycosyltransferase involved in cell wall biosynthesis